MLFFHSFSSKIPSSIISLLLKELALAFLLEQLILFFSFILNFASFLKVIFTENWSESCPGLTTLFCFSTSKILFYFSYPWFLMRNLVIQIIVLLCVIYFLAVSEYFVVFEQFDFNISEWQYPWVYSFWNSLSFLNL